jgi:hypothetical protein
MSCQGIIRRYAARENINFAIGCRLDSIDFGVHLWHFLMPNLPGLELAKG